ncbi:MAG: hypothetical protein ACTTJC_08945, partial [Campylobacter sp.]
MWLIRNLINLKHNRNFIGGVKNARSWKENLLGGALGSAGGAGVDYLNKAQLNLSGFLAATTSCYL